MEKTDPDMLPTQAALWGLITGLDNNFISIAWPFQSWVLFNDGKPIPEVERLKPIEFMTHCYEVAIDFMWANEPAIRSIADASIGPSDIPPFTGARQELAEICDVIANVWGYDPRNDDLTTIENKQINACIIFTIFCSLCRASKRDIDLEHAISLPNFDSERILFPCPYIESIDEFCRISEKYLKSYPRLSLCAAISTSDGFRFFVMEQQLNPDSTKEIISDLIVATKAKEIYLCYFSDLSGLSERDLGPFQSIVFRVDQESSAPYLFCRMVVSQDSWLIRPFSHMAEPDKNENIMLSNITLKFLPKSANEVDAARSRLERWSGKKSWNWCN